MARAVQKPIRLIPRPFDLASVCAPEQLNNHRVQFECQHGNRSHQPMHIYFLGPNSILAL